MTHGDSLIKHAPILHIDPQPQLEPVLFRNEASQAPTEGLPQAIDELNDVGDVFFWCVALEEQCIPQGPRFGTAGEGELINAPSHLSAARRCHLGRSESRGESADASERAS